MSPSPVKRVLHALELRQPDGRPASFFVNRDLLPVPPEERKWTAINYFTFWIADSFNVNTFMIASSGIALGMTWWQCWLAVWVGYSISALFLAANAVGGARYHLVFPAFIRSSFGVVGGIWPALNRAVMACVWYGTQAWLGGQAIYCLLLAIWPSTLGWAFVTSATGAIANMATLITNAVDFASRASKPSDVILPQIISLPVCFAITSLIGILIGSSTKEIFGDFVWNPLDVMERLLETDGTRGMRAGIAFIAIGFVIAQLGTNVAANSLSAGCDLTSILPRFLNIRRGGYIAALIGFCICPWNFLSSSSNFTTYLSAYSVFLSSVVGVMMSHWFFVVRGRVKVADLYHFERDGIYRYYYGFNLRAYAAYIAGIAINVVGFAGAVGQKVPLAAERIYNLSFLTGWPVAALTYYILCRIWPIPIPTDEEIAAVPAVLLGGDKAGISVAAGIPTVGEELGYEGVEKEDDKLDLEKSHSSGRGAVEMV
ncbi:hypothetical protein JCM8202_006361 [Rhodotorula sphaerocarpa]